MATVIIAILGLLASTFATPLDHINPEHLPDLLSRQTNITCPSTPNPMPKAASFPSIKTMPDPFLYLDGKTRVQSKQEWLQCRQPEILKLLQEYQYGYYPSHSQETVSASRSGTTLTITIAAGGKSANIAATLNLPSGSGPFPVIISIGSMDTKSYLNAGIAIVTFDYSKVAADSTSKTGAFWTLYSGRDIGVLTAWAWATHRILDALALAVPQIDATKAGVTGCSRLGKAALAAGLFDPRIALTMPMCSGVQGAGPYRYSLSGQGENLENAIRPSFCRKAGAPWWTTSSISQFLGKSTQLPFDAHTIVSAIAPRAVILSQNANDQFTDSKGTAQITFPAAKLVYGWLGAGEKLGMSIPSGGHCDVSGYADVLPFVQKVLQGKSTGRDYDDLKGWKNMPETYPWGTDLPKGK